MANIQGPNIIWRSNYYIRFSFVFCSRRFQGETYQMWLRLLRLTFSESLDSSETELNVGSGCVTSNDLCMFVFVPWPVRKMMIQLPITAG